MRFDLEISNLHTDLVYISEKQEIPAGAVPLYYLNMDTRDKVPSDFFSLEDNVLIDNLAGQGSQTVEGPAFVVSGNKFNMTHVATYSVQGNAKVPLFFKHVIYDRVHEDAIRVTDYFGIQIAREDYLVEEKSDHTNVYINRYPKTLFVEYVSDNRIYKKLLDLQPVFTEIGWEDFVVLDTNVPEYKYMITDNFVQTSYAGKLYLSYTYETDLLRLPVCNIEDDWYLAILNTTFSINRLVPGLQDPQPFNYSVPEFYVQNADAERYYRQFINKKAKILFDNYIQLQTPIAREKAEDIYVYIYDFYTNALKYAVTTNYTLNGKQVPKEMIRDGSTYVGNIYYLYTDNYNGDGIIGLPVKLAPTDVAYTTYSILDQYYEFRFLNLNSSTLNNGGFFAMYMIPNITELEEGVYFARIGLPRTVALPAGQFQQGMQFETVDEYNQFITDNNCYSIAILSLFGNYESSILNTKDARGTGGEIIDRKAACLATVDMLYKDIIEGNISIPTNDTLIANIDADSLMARKLLKTDPDSNELDLDSKDLLAKIESTIKSNLDASSMPILDVTYTYEKPANGTVPEPSYVKPIAIRQPPAPPPSPWIDVTAPANWYDGIPAFGDSYPAWNGTGWSNNPQYGQMALNTYGTNGSYPPLPFWAGKLFTKMRITYTGTLEHVELYFQSDAFGTSWHSQVTGSTNGANPFEFDIDPGVVDSLIQVFFQGTCTVTKIEIYIP